MIKNYRIKGEKMKRQMSVNGSFYPASCEEVIRMIDSFNLEHYYSCKPKALIVPHAGYIYSGFTANAAFGILNMSQTSRVVVIGPSHRVYLNGLSGSFYDSYDTPCGEFEIDRVYLDELARKFDIKFIPDAHREHSTEVQMPFLKHYLPKSKVVELIYGDQDFQNLCNVIEYILKDDSNLNIISSDLSHYYDQKKANRLDSYCIKAVEKLDNNLIDSGCEACRKIGIKAMIAAAKSLNLNSKIIDYRTSGDVSGEKSAVVGYMSAVFF